jgi:hypothetical protein
MDWWLIGLLVVLGITIITLISIYRRSLSEGRALTNFLLAMTLHDEVYKSQRENLSKYITMIAAKDPIDLKMQVALRTQEMVQRVENTVSGMVIERLWKLRAGELKL